MDIAHRWWVVLQGDAADVASLRKELREPGVQVHHHGDEWVMTAESFAEMDDAADVWREASRILGTVENSGVVVGSLDEIVTDGAEGGQVSYSPFSSVYMKLGPQED